jgi:hypothetical protein
VLVKKTERSYEDGVGVAQRLAEIKVLERRTQHAYASFYSRSKFVSSFNDEGLAEFILPLRPEHAWRRYFPSVSMF